VNSPNPSLALFFFLKTIATHSVCLLEEEATVMTMKRETPTRGLSSSDFLVRLSKLPHFLFLSYPLSFFLRDLFFKSVPVPSPCIITIT
jgi:hypothetical protein